MGNAVTVRDSTSVWKEVEKMQERIMKRAYDIFTRNGGVFGNDLADWLAAERELILKPPIELVEDNNAFQLRIEVAGVDPKDLDIEATPDFLLVKAETRHDHEGRKGEIHACEFESGHLFRSVHFPKRIDPESLKAEFKNGILTISADIAKEARVRKIAVGAA